MDEAAWSPATSTSGRTRAGTATAARSSSRTTSSSTATARSTDVRCQRLQEENYFFQLSDVQRQAAQALRRATGLPAAEARVQRDVLAARSRGCRTSRSRGTSLSWGIRSPWNADHIIYVWIEALQNYVTALGYPDGELFDRCWPADVHVIGKEIVRHHAVVWPAMLMAVGLPLPKRVFAHGWLLVGGEKISKSGRGITDISPYELVDEFGLDALPLPLPARGSRGGEDGNFSLEDMHARYNAELANDLGNLASRTLNMIERYCDGVVPAAEVVEDPEDALLANVASARGRSRRARRRSEGHRTRSRGSGRSSVTRTATSSSGSRGSSPRTRRTRRWSPASCTRRRAPWPRSPRCSRPVMPLAMARPLVAPRLRRASRAWTRRPPEGNRVTVGDALFPRLETRERRDASGRLAGLIDSHCHLGHIERPPDDVLAEARAAGVDAVIDIGMGLDESRSRRRRARSTPTASTRRSGSIRTTSRSSRPTRTRRWRRSRELAASPRVVAIGETGLDFYRDRSSPEHAGSVVPRAHRAREGRRRTLVIHCRDAHDDVLHVLDDEGAPARVVMHCFSGDVAFARACDERGFFCSFAGNITYKRNDDLRDAARVVDERPVARRNRRAVPRAGAVPRQTERSGARRAHRAASRGRRGRRT